MPSTKRATSLDVARQAGVSRTTVSFVLNQVPGVNISQATRQRVLEAARALNYHPNSAGRKLASGKSNTIGLVLRQSPEQVFADAFLVQVVLGVEQIATQEGFHILLKPVEPEDTTGYARLINENHVDGIILSGPRQDDAEIIRLYREGIPIILLGQLPESNIPFVDINAEAGAASAVEHLIALGHRHIGIVTNAPLTYTSAQQRLNGFCKAMEAHHLEIYQEWIKEGNYTPASGFSAMNEVLQQPKRPTAMFIASDVVAMGAIQAIKRAGLRIPADMSVVGFDDVPLAAYFDPPLTTVHLPAYGLGWAAGERLIRLIHSEGLDQDRILLDSQLIVRESTARITL